MSKITDLVAELAEPVAREAGCEIWDVEYLKEAGSWYLRVYLDKEEGVSIEDCEMVSRALDPILDEKDLILTNYIFEVSSPGTERALKRPGDFVRFMGENIEIRHYQPVGGAKTHVGILKAYDNGDVTIESNGSETLYKKAQIAQVRLRTKI